MYSIDSVMSTDLITLPPSASLADARSLMHDKHIHHLPIVDEAGTLVGLVTLTNILAATDSILRDSDSRIHAADVRVEDVMVTDLATVDIRASLRQAALFLENHGIGCLPVLEKGKLHGIITDSDFVALAINLLEQLEESDAFDDDFAEAGF